MPSLISKEYFSSAAHYYVKMPSLRHLTFRVDFSAQWKACKQLKQNVSGWTVEAVKKILKPLSDLIPSKLVGKKLEMLRVIVLPLVFRKSWHKYGSLKYEGQYRAHMASIGV